MSQRLSALVGQFLRHLRVAGYASRTIEGYEHTLARLLSVLADQDIDQAHEVTSQVLAAHQTQLVTRGGVRGRPLTLAAQANWVGQVKTFFKFLVRSGYVLVNPAQLLDVPHPPRRPPDHVLNLAAMHRLLLSPDTRTRRGVRDRAILELFYSTGVRVSELVGIDAGDIDLVAGELTVRRGKGGKARRVPVGAAACQWVARYLKAVRPGFVVRPGEHALFVSQRGRRFDRAGIAKIVRTHAKAGGLKIRVTPHAIRHAFATHMLHGKASLRHLQEILGHAQLTTTQLYTRVDITDLKEVHRRCHPRGRG